MIGIRPMAPVLNKVHLKVSEHKMLSFSVRKEIVKNDNSLVVTLLSKAVENEFLQTVQPILKVESSYCYYLDMLTLQKNERNDVYIFFARRDVGKLTCLTQFSSVYFIFAQLHTFHLRLTNNKINKLLKIRWLRIWNQ